MMKEITRKKIEVILTLIVWSIIFIQEDKFIGIGLAVLATAICMGFAFNDTLDKIYEDRPKTLHD